MIASRLVVITNDFGSFLKLVTSSRVNSRWTPLNCQQARVFSMRTKNATLPRLPVPDPNKTLGHFLNFAESLQTKQELEHTKLVVKDFAAKELPILQKLLEQRAEKLNNWLTPWWLNVAYLQSRDPLPITTSPGLILPRFSWSSKDCQTECAAKVTQAAVKFYLKIANGELPQDMFGKTPLDMSQYMLIFGTTRIPKKGCDEIRYGCANENQPQHVIVLHNGHVFAIPILTRTGSPLSLSALNTLFNEVIKQSPHQLDYSVGVVSSDNRDNWAEIYEQLKAHSSNSINLSFIENALFAVCLDQDFEPFDGYEEKDEFARQCLHGGGCKSNSRNRWFDKTLQFIIGKNGSVGVTYEHTPAEGPPVAAMLDFICDEIYTNDFKEDSILPEDGVKRLNFELDDSQKAQIKRSEKQIDKAAADLDVVVHTFKRYGKNFPKSVGISPDSYIQMAFQLAFYRIHLALPPTYETATLRKFVDGRTENIRSPDVLASVFVKKMTTGQTTVTEIFDALQAAASSHKKYTLDCMNGSGMDRHFLAWNLLALENGLKKPSILETPAYQQMAHFQLSTSQVPTRNHIQLCFGPSALDCYGICYNPQETELHFAVTSFRSYGSTSSKRFVKQLDRALNDMNSVCNKARRAMSKL